jgi:hypothetical protein
MEEEPMNKKVFFIITLTLAAGLLLSACAADTSVANLQGNGNANSDAAVSGNAYAGGIGNGGAENGYGDSVTQDNSSGNPQAPRDGQHLVSPSGDLSEAERASLNFMREEEKLAQDVYQYLYELWDYNSFQSIAQSELTHASSVLSVLTAYGQSDPSEGLAAGEFTDAELQVLYDTLIERGSKTLADALKVGAEIEEIDIRDLQIRLAETQNEQIQEVYSNLLKGSYNHLRAYTRALQAQTGEVYQPLHLSNEEYQAVLAGSNGGGQAQSGQGKGQGGQGKGQGGQSQGSQGGGKGQAGQGKGSGGEGGGGQGGCDDLGSCERQNIQPTPAVQF